MQLLPMLFTIGPVILYGSWGRTDYGFGKSLRSDKGMGSKKVSYWHSQTPLASTESLESLREHFIV
jgi:hypothetical protein